VLDQHLWSSIDDVREAAWWWMVEYNEERPHDSLGDMTPAEYRRRVAGSSSYAVCAWRGSLRWTSICRHPSTTCVRPHG